MGPSVGEHEIVCLYHSHDDNGQCSAGYFRAVLSWLTEDNKEFVESSEPNNRPGDQKHSFQTQLKYVERDRNTVHRSLSYKPLSDACPKHKLSHWLSEILMGGDKYTFFKSVFSAINCTNVQDLDTAAPPPDHHCQTLVRHQCKMAALLSAIFWLPFCTASSIFTYSLWSKVKKCVCQHLYSSLIKDVVSGLFNAVEEEARRPHSEVARFISVFSKIVNSLSSLYFIVKLWILELPLSPSSLNKRAKAKILSRLTDPVSALSLIGLCA